MKIFCNTCKIKTNHKLKSEHKRLDIEIDDYGPEPIYLYEEKWIYNFWVCCGCDSATLEEKYNGPGMEDENRVYYDSKYYPKRTTSEHLPKTFKSIDSDLNIIYQEVIKTYNCGLKLSCAIGLRALLEAICINKGITDKESWGLAGKLDKLKEKKHLPENIVEGLHSFKFMGDNAAHRLKISSDKELQLAIEIVEDLLNFLYEINYRLQHSTKELAQNHINEYKKMKKNKK